MIDITESWYLMKAASTTAALAYEYGEEGYADDWGRLAGFVIQIGALALEAWDMSHECPNPNQEHDGNFGPRCSDGEFLSAFSLVYSHILATDIQALCESEGEEKVQKMETFNERFGGRNPAVAIGSAMVMLEEQGIHPHEDRREDNGDGFDWDIPA